MTAKKKKDTRREQPAPGKTPGQAEGARDRDAKRAGGDVDPGKTPGKAEGERE